MLWGRVLGGGGFGVKIRFKVRILVLVWDFHFSYMISFVFRVYVFEVWCEQRRLFGNLEIAEAIAGFLHLAFVFDLKNPAVSISGYGIR